MHDLHTICDRVCAIARETGAYIRSQTGQLTQGHVESKGIHNFVTYVDKTAELQLVAALQKLLPEAGFIVEENTSDKKGADYHWVVDPLDGTTNFIHGVPVFCVSIALMHQSEVVVGVVYEINHDECFRAVMGHGAFLNDRPISVSGARSVNDTLLATGFPYYDYKRINYYMELFTWCLRNSHGVRRLGSAAADLAYVACGRYGGYFEYSLSPWDVAAGSLLVAEAGGLISDFSGGNNFIHGNEIIATNPYIYTELLHQVKLAFKL